MADPIIMPFVLCGLGSAGLLLLLVIGHLCEQIIGHAKWVESKPTDKGTER